MKEEKLFREQRTMMLNNNPFDSLDEGSDASSCYPTARGVDSKRGLVPDTINEDNSVMSAIESLRENYSK